jgi:UDP-glucose 4-epimerase
MTKVLITGGADHAGRRFVSTAKSRQELGFEAAAGLQDGLRRTVEWPRANIDRIDACVDRHADRLATA